MSIIEWLVTWFLLLPVDGDGGGVDPAGGEEVPEPDVAVLRHEAVRPRGQRGRVKLEQRGEVVTVRHRDQVVHGLPGVTA